MSRTIHVKGAPKELCQRLESSAERNSRSVDREAPARLEFGFDIENALVSKVHQRWMAEAMAGTFRRGSTRRLKQIAAKAKARQ